MRFAAPPPGTYHYWATTGERSLRERLDVDGPLGGAFIVDPRAAPVTDRVFVIGLWRKPGTGPGTGQKPFELGTINGRSWPGMETLEHRVGDVIRWRVINLSFDMHAMHLHGNYFSVVSTGDGATFRAHASEDRQQVVTEHMDRGETLEMEWTPARAGNWLFHCHMVLHMTPLPDEGVAGAQHHAEDDSAGMAGLVLGIRVTGDSAPAAQVSAEPRRFTLRLREEPGRYGSQAGYRVDAEGIESTRLGKGAVPAPLIALTRAEPVEVALVNEMSERTAIHWHGIELDSYFDGVPGWGGSAGSVTPAIEPGRTFTARFTPPRAGTFIYHTHWHDEAQLIGGLYGALIVVSVGETYDFEITPSAAQRLWLEVRSFSGEWIAQALLVAAP